MDSFLNRCCAFGLILESILLNQRLNIFFQQYQSKADMTPVNWDVCFTPESGH
jgi:hypothetical protein